MGMLFTINARRTRRSARGILFRIILLVIFIMLVLLVLNIIMLFLVLVVLVVLMVLHVLVVVVMMMVVFVVVMRLVIMLVFREPLRRNRDTRNKRHRGHSRSCSCSHFNSLHTLQYLNSLHNDRSGFGVGRVCDSVVLVWDIYTHNPVRQGRDVMGVAGHGLVVEHELLLHASDMTSLVLLEEIVAGKLVVALVTSVANTLVNSFVHTKR